jgi:uncharacterized protein
MSVAFVDANIPMYAIGGPHPLREPSVRVLELIAERPAAFVTSSEVLQEILHRYMRLERWEVGRELMSAFSELLAGRVEPVLAEDVLYAGHLAEERTAAGARDLVHEAVMRRLGVTHIISADRGFDGIEGVTRLDPAHFEMWASSLD